jgi:hypothetical protein
MVLIDVQSQVPCLMLISSVELYPLTLGDPFTFTSTTSPIVTATTTIDEAFVQQWYDRARLYQRNNRIVHHYQP